MGVWHAGVLEAGGDQPFVQLGVEQACELREQLADVVAIG